MRGLGKKTAPYCFAASKAHTVHPHHRALDEFATGHQGHQTKIETMGSID
jgi:hypothetical protein